MINGHWIDSLGYIAGVLTTFSLVPQVARIWRLKMARDVSIEMYLLFGLGVVLWFWYGVVLHSWPMILWNAITFVLTTTIIALKLRFDRNASREIVHPLSRERQS